MPDVITRILCHLCCGEISDGHVHIGIDGVMCCSECFLEHYRYCDDCGGVTTLANAYYDEGNDEYYCENCCQRENSDDSDLVTFESESINLSNTTFKHLRDKRCFGVELEIDRKELPYQKIKESTKFGSKYDGSLGCGAEFVSPILQGDIGFNEIQRLCNIVGNINVGRRSGFHVHFDARDLRWQSIKKIWMVYNIFEGVLYSMLPNSRTANTYCRKSNMTVANIKKIASAEDLQDIWYSQNPENSENDHYNQTRYLGFNLHSYFHQSTIEIRYHSGTINFEKIINWIKINQAIISYALNHSEAEIEQLLDFKNCFTNYTRIRKLFKTVISRGILWTYYKKRFEAFNSQKEYGYYRKEVE